MSLHNPSDFNGDGQTNYVDYQIYKNYIDTDQNPYTRQSRVSNQSDPTMVWIGFAIVGVFFFISVRFDLFKGRESTAGIAFVILIFAYTCLYTLIQKRIRKRKERQFQEYLEEQSKKWK